MTEQMDRIWDDATKDIAYRESKTERWCFATAYHGSGNYTLTIRDSPYQQQTTLHLTREELETLGDAVATALGGCLYLADEDRDSEMTP
jgi:hypothetical protein